MKKFRVIIRVEKEYTRIVSAKTEAQAVRKVKEAIASKPIKISKKNFEEFPSVEEGL